MSEEGCLRLASQDDDWFGFNKPETQVRLLWAAQYARPNGDAHFQKMPRVTNSIQRERRNLDLISLEVMGPNCVQKKSDSVWKSGLAGPMETHAAGPKETRVCVYVAQVRLLWAMHLHAKKWCYNEFFCRFESETVK